jgi:hypothetical protein
MKTLLPGLALAVLIAVGVATAENIDPDNDGSQYAWAENVGWINLEPSGDGGPGVEVLDAELTGYAWFENLGWVNLSCSNNSTCATVDFRVTNDGNGVLSGYAWSENAGWISFSCANQASCGTVDYGVTIDGYNGDFSGYAWGENIGWIRFASDGPNPFVVRTSWCSSLDPDADSFTGCTGDCANDDADIYTGAPEINDGKDNQCGTDEGAGLVDEIENSIVYTDPVDKDTFCWNAQPGATEYEIARATDPTFATNCVSAVETEACHTDTDEPPLGEVFYYAVRASAPNVGSWGRGDSGQERVFSCP